jgi:hypothetical protein
MKTATSTTTIKRTLDPEDAETHNIETVERIGRRSSHLHWKNSAAAASDHHPEKSTSSVSSPRLKLVARRVMLLNHQRRQQQQQQSEPQQKQLHTRRKSSKPSELLHQISTRGNAETSKQQAVPVSKDDSEMEAPLYRAAGIWLEESSDEDAEENEAMQSSGFLLSHRHSKDQQYGSIPLHTTTTTRIPVAYSIQLSLKRILRKLASTCCCCFYSPCHPYMVWQWFYRVCICSFFTTLAIPLFIMAWILYYGLGNPQFDFLPARLSWCLNFLGRQIVTLELARISTWIFLDVMILGNHRIMIPAARRGLFWGPIVTMTALQARGWPFVVTAWAIWDLLLLHGDNRKFFF